MKIRKTCEYASSCFECPLPDCIVTRMDPPNLNMTEYDMAEYDTEDKRKKRSLGQAEKEKRK